MPLLVCATPIGNLADVTHRVLDALRDADLVLCEDTRRTQVLLDRYGIRARGLVSVHRHNEARQARELLPRLQSGETLALVSDAGLPGVNDPGGRLVEAALAAEVEVTVLPGPSAVETALVASGLAGRAVPVPRLPPAAGGRARDALGGLASVAVRGRRVRVAQAPCRIARGPRPHRPGPARGCVPRADEALRGDRPRQRCRAGRAVRRSGQGRGDGRRRPRRGAWTTVSTTRSLPSVRSLPQEPPDVPRRTPSRVSSTSPGTSSTAARSRRPIDAVRRRRYPSFSALPAQRMKEVLRASSSRIRGDGPCGARPERLGHGVVVARGRRRAPSVRARRRRVRRRTASRHRRRRIGGLSGESAGRPAR